MKVHLNQIPEGETLYIEGEESVAALGLEEAGVVPVSPLHYSLDVGVSDGGLFATGSIKLRARFQCVSCLEDFEADVAVDPFSMQLELGGREWIDLTPEIREDIHLTLPAHPRCDSSGGPKCLASCNGLPNASRDSVPEHASAWDALEKLKTKKQ